MIDLEQEKKFLIKIFSSLDVSIEGEFELQRYIHKKPPPTAGTNLRNHPPLCHHGQEWNFALLGNLRYDT